MSYILYCRKKEFLGVFPDLLVTDTNLGSDHRKLKEPYVFQGILEHHIPANLSVLLLEDTQKAGILML